NEDGEAPVARGIRLPGAQSPRAPLLAPPVGEEEVAVQPVGAVALRPGHEDAAVGKRSETPLGGDLAERAVGAVGEPPRPKMRTAILGGLQVEKRGPVRGEAGRAGPRAEGRRPDRLR